MLKITSTGAVLVCEAGLTGDSFSAQERTANQAPILQHSSLGAGGTGGGQLEGSCTMAVLH